MLNFQITDLELTVDKLKRYGAVLDGDIIDENEKKIACLRSPDGHMIGLI